MNKKEHIKYWLESAKHDLAAANSLFKSKRYDWCLFLCHLVIEKTLKAIWVEDNKNSTPPKVHNLLKLAEQTKLNLNSGQKLFLLDINDFNIEVRYPDYKLSFYKKCNKDFTENNYKKIRSFYLWLLRRM
ncbi:MAG: HEPN domain-containing protein [Elusimicrobia bacterium]|nr:HEPN domain-containing protein [Candidatus Liberimonas magnetica]